MGGGPAAFFANGCEAPAARHRSPAAPRSPRQGIPIARKILRKRCGGECIASGVGFHPENPITGPAPKVRQRCCPRSIADISPLTRPAVNPGVGTGLPHSILAWAQDCPTKSWRGHRIAILNPGVGTGVWAQDCPGVSQKTLEAQCCTALRPQTRRPDCAEKNRQCVGTQRCTPGLAARIARKTTEAHCCIAGHSRKKNRLRCRKYGISPGLAALPGFKFGK